MNFYDVKFTLNLEGYNHSFIADAFDRAKGILNWQFDEDFNAVFIDNDIEYQIMDVSSLEKGKIEEIKDSFFSFSFDNVKSVPLYKFLVLENNNQTMVLSNINSLIFDYSSLNDFYKLFEHLDNSSENLDNSKDLNTYSGDLDNSKDKNTSPKFDLDSYYGNLKDYLNSFDFEKDSNYWLNHILDSSNYLKFYNIKENDYKSQKINIDKDSISDFIKEKDSSLFDFYGSVFSLYLSRIDRLDGSMLKTIISSEKTDVNDDSSITDLNFFDKKTYLKIDLNKKDNFNDLLERFNLAFKDAINHTKVDADNYLDQSASYYSIYDFSKLNENIEIFNGEGSALTLNIYEDCLELVYNSNIFSEVYIEHMAKNIESLMFNILYSSLETVSDINILSDEEKLLIKEFSKGRTVEVDEDKILSQAFREHALNNPDSIAVDDGVNQVTFGQLEKSSNSVARDLYENYNIGPGSPIGLMLPRDYHYIEMVLALNKIGAACVPIDMIFPANRIEHMLSIAQAENLITVKDNERALDLNANIIFIEDLNHDNEVDLEILGKVDDLLLILFTSGTTGLPKGVMFNNRQFIWAAAAYDEIFDISYGDIDGCYFSFSFIASFILYISLYLGGSIRIFNEEEQKNSLLLIEELKEKPMNSLTLPPAVGIPIYENEELKLDYLILAGAKINELSKRKRHTKIVNMYGTTEVTFGISKIYDLNEIKDDHVPLGKPVANSWAYILDEDGREMPVGVPGEICISSEMLSPGYYNDPELTSKLFVDNPLSDRQINKKMYRTGDIGFYNFDGEIEIIGREDNQLSVRGFRIESNEILSVMKKFEEISGIYLDVENDNLIAYYTTNADLDINQVKDALKTELPYYMIPSLFIELDEIPLNINGKIDKSSLRTVMNNEDIEIADDVFRSVVDSFKEVLNLDYVLIDDDFVSLGGNSLSAMKLQLLLKKKLGVSLSSNELMELSTPNEIANHIKFNLNVHSTVDEDKYSFDESCPLSESQLNVYLDESVNEMGTAYNNPFRIDFKDSYSIENIKEAIIRLTEIFPILKARVINDDGELHFTFDGEIEIIEGSLEDIGSFVRPFELDKNLSRFLIAEEDGISLCLDFHHMIFDGSSLNVLLNCLISILNGKDIDFIDKGALRELSFEEIVDSEYMDSAKEFFDDLLADKDEVYELLPSVECENEFLDSLNDENDLSPSLANDYEFIDTFDMDIDYLSSFLKDHSITFNQFFTSVFGYTLSRFSGSSKVLFNIIEDGRGHIDLSSSVGMFVKTLPILLDCKNQDIDSFLDYSSKLINSVMKYDLYPFRMLASEHDLSSDILFQYSHNLFSDVLNNDLSYSIEELKHDLISDISFFILNNGKDKLSIRVLYSSKYSKDFIEHFVQSYKLILNGIINDKFKELRELKDINYITEDDIKLLDSFNQTEHPIEYEDVLDAFNDNLLKNPQHKLVEYYDVSYTYAEGAYISKAIAKKLLDLGVESQDCISFLVPRSELYIFPVLAVMSIGAVYVPLDDNLLDERIEFMISDTDSKVIIVSDDTYQRAKDLTRDSLVLNISEIIAEFNSTKGGFESLNNLDNPNDLVLDNTYGDLACILYTSGSTGLPKGVKITRKSIINFIDFHVHDLEILREDVYGLFASIGFDVAMAAIFSVIYSGACLNIIPNDIKLNIKGLNNHFIKYGVTHSYITTQIAKLFISQIEETSLKVLVAGGEKLGQIDEIRDYRIVDAYGPTEACVYVISADTRDKIDYSSVGYVQNNTKAYILDSEFRRVPIGAVGELYLSGVQLADGYLNRPEESSKAFLNNPFEDDEKYEGLYCTGDVARILPDGTYGIVGRRDSQVKIRGNRVELLEVEAAIRDLDIIEDVTVQTIKNGENNELVAYIVSSLDEDELRTIVSDYLIENKPDYMVPSFIVKLESIPLNVNGKVDKRALPKVNFDSLHTDYVPPRTEEEKIIVEAFEKHFNGKIGIYDDFIRLGGDSLTAIKISSYLKDYNITAVDILSLHTPYAIAQNMKREELELDIYTLESGCPLNESQLNVYLDIIVNNKDDAYIIPLLMEISRKYDINQVQDALARVIDVHLILSMHVNDEFEVPYLVKGSKPPIIVKEDIDDGFIIEFLNKPFDLDENLCRFLILDDPYSRKDDGDYKLFAAFNHIIFDGLSTGVFKDDLQSILDGEKIEADESFLKVSAFSQAIQSSEEYLNAKGFYESMLADTEESGILIESIDASEQGKVSIALDLDADLLKSFLDSHSVSENVLFTGAFAYALSRFTGSEYASFNLVENGRDRFDNFKSIGMYVNTLPLFVDCKNQEISSFMGNMANLIYDAIKYNYYPFRLLANEYNINSDVLFQFVPDWMKTGKFSDNLSLNGSESGEFSEKLSLNITENDILSRRDNTIADFNVEVSQDGDNYNLGIMHSDKYSKDFVNQFAKSYNLILQQMISAHNLEDIDYITMEDIEILDAYNQTEHSFEFNDILDAFNDNLSKYENNLLVSYGDNDYTHGQGAFISNEIADRLNDLGIEKQDFVALFVNRSEWFLLASLGVLTVGGIYVPIETGYPDERIVLMLKDTGSKLVIVDDDSEKQIKRIILENDLDIDLLNVSDVIVDDIPSANHLNSVEIDEDDVACVLYTSGTTGVPKGVLVTRKAINNFVSWYVNETNFTEEDVYGMHCSYVFDMHTHALYSPVITGGALCIVPEDIRLDLKALNDYFVEHGCTHTYITSQVGKLFAESGMETTIKLICFGGMKLGELNAPDSVGPFESYGPSENLAISTSIFANKRIHNTSIGRFISNVKGYVLDNEHRRVPIGAVGELYLSGAQLTPGYLNRQEENDKSFFENPFDDEKGYERIYATGDIVRVLSDGTLGIVGRRDSQVKIRGNRVELTEVESAIRNIDYIEDVTVQVVANNGNNELVAYVVLSEGFDGELTDSLDLSEGFDGDLSDNKVLSDGFDGDLVDYVREEVSKRKPAYMVPSYVIQLDEIPLNVNGKVDKSALPEVDLSSLHVDYLAPTNETEKHIIDAFELVFNQQIGLNDDFVRLGGDSITAIRVISFLEKKGITCSARDILTYKTPYLIGQNIQSVETVSYDPVEGFVDLLPIQEYFFSEINEDNFAQYFLLKSKEEIDKNTLQDTFNELTNVHDMLRARFSFNDDREAIQEILPVNSQICEINEYNISNDFKNSLKEIFINSSNSLNMNNLIEINLIHHNGKSYIMFIIHHLIIDGVSWNILITDFTNLYLSLKSGKKTEVLRPYPYKNWVEDLRKLVEDISPDEKEYWMEINDLLDDSSILGDSKPFRFNTDFNYDVNNLLMLSEEEYWALAIARAYKKTYGKDIIFNRETHGRDESIAKVNGTIGWFTSQYPVLANSNTDYDDISLMNDVYNIKRAFKDVDNLGLNYLSLIYTTGELEFKHCPVTINFLSSEFTFENELFESLNQDSTLMENIDNNLSKSYGITFNILNLGDSYDISGDYAENTYIGDKFETLIENIKFEAEFITNHKFKDNSIVCCLSESQLGVYLDEKANEKGSAYSTPGIFECGLEYSIDEVKGAIHALIDKHPILRGRILDTENILLLVCDSYPDIEIINNAEDSTLDESVEIINNPDYFNLIKPFDLNKSLSRFFIIDGHTIFYDMHHIISDASSRTIINKELEQVLAGNLDNSIDLGFAYASNDSFESKYDNKYKSAREFFHNEFADIDEVQHIISDIDGSKGSVSLPIRGIRQDVESFANKKGITVGSLLNGVFAYTYSRFTGSDKIYYNFTVHGRNEDYLMDSLGMFVRTIPIIVDCENKPISDFVSDVSDLILKSIENSIYPFRLLAREFDLNNEVLFEYNYDLVDFDIDNEMLVRDDADSVSQFLCLVNDLEDGFVVTVSHLDKFSRHTAKQFVKVFKEILLQFLDSENLGDIDYISSEDIELLDSYNQTEHPLDYYDLLDAFNDNLAKYPDNRLVEYLDVSYTYAEGAIIADAIAKRLEDLGVEVQDRVSFIVPCSDLYIFCVLGIMSLGAVYVPLDDAHPDERLEFMLKDTESKVLIVSDDSLERGKDLAEDCVLLNISEIINEFNSVKGRLDSSDEFKSDNGESKFNLELESSGDEFKSDNGESKFNLELESKNFEFKSINKLDDTYGHLACILYTSGSTGLPKGVKITRKSIINFIDFHVHDLEILREDVYGLFASIGFDVAMAAIFSVIYSGACLNIIPKDIKLNIKGLNNHFIKYGVTHSYITTQIAKLFISQIEETSLKVLVAGGEKLGQIDEERDYRIVDAYGPTEACVYVISADTRDKIDYSSVGYVQNNTKAYILDSEFRRVPIGTVGELYLSGVQLADGYLNMPEESSKAFLNNPFEDDEKYDRLYCTGDVARILPDGTYGIVGRRDSQVKIRGNRVELLEVEAAIRDLDIIEDVTVQTIKNGENDELVAYIVSSLDEDELGTFVRDYLIKNKPDYMVPSFIVKLESIPLNVNGKVDKNALPELDFDSLHTDYLPPRTEEEKIIVEAFEREFKGKIGIHDDFIRLGGDSLTAIKISSYIKSYDVTMADIFAFRTPEAIAKNISEFSFDLNLYSLETGCPLNGAQVNVFADVTAFNKKIAYHVPGYLAISKEYGLDNVLNSLYDILEAHPILGMRISDIYEESEEDISNKELLIDLIKIARKFGISQIMDLINAYGLNNLKGLYNMIRTIMRLFSGEYPYLVKGSKPPVIVLDEIDEESIIDFFSESLDLFSNLSKFMIVETEDSYYLLYMISHIIFDAISAGVFKSDFQTLLDGGSVRLDDIFLKTSALTQQIKNTGKFDEAREFYSSILSDIDDIGVLEEVNSSDGYSISYHDLDFDKQAYKSFLNKAGIRENVFFTGVFSYALSQILEGDRVLFTMIENGRDRFVEDFIGMTSNVMPVVIDCKDQSIGSFMESTSKNVYDVLRYSYYPIFLLYPDYDFEFHIMFHFVPNWIADDFNDIAGIGSQRIVDQVFNNFTDYLTEFFVQVYQYDDDYKLIIINSNKYSKEMINEFKEAFISVLNNIISSDISSNLSSTLR